MSKAWVLTTQTKWSSHKLGELVVKLWEEDNRPSLEEIQDQLINSAGFITAAEFRKLLEVNGGEADFDDEFGHITFRLRDFG